MLAVLKFKNISAQEGKQFNIFLTMLRRDAIQSIDNVHLCILVCDTESLYSLAMYIYRLIQTHTHPGFRHVNAIVSKTTPQQSSSYLLWRRWQGCVQHAAMVGLCLACGDGRVVSGMRRWQGCVSGMMNIILNYFQEPSLCSYVRAHR